MDILLAVAITAITTSVISPTGVEFEKLIDSTVQLPGTTEFLYYDGFDPVPCGDGVLIRVVEDTLPIRSWAYFITASNVEVVVNGDTRVSGYLAQFEKLLDFRCSGDGTLVFMGKEAPPSDRAYSIYEWQRGRVSLLQSGGVDIAGKAVGNLFEVTSNSLNLGFLGRLNEPPRGDALFLKPAGEAPIFVTDETVILPGQEDAVKSLTFIGQRSGELLFNARTPVDKNGVYRWSSDRGFSVVADDSTPVPGETGTFDGAGGYAVLADGIAFFARWRGKSREGIFLERNDGGIEPLVVPGLLTEDGQTIKSAFLPRGAGDLLVFTGWTLEESDYTAFARTPDGRILRLLSVGDTIESRTVSGVVVTADHENVILRATSGPHTAIYRLNLALPTTEIPSLSVTGAVVFAVLLVTLGIVTSRRLGL